MSNDKDTLRDEYPEDLIKSGVRGKYAKRYREGTNIVLIDPDLHKLSAVDATSFTIMKRARIRLAFAFDHHFAVAGFRLVA